jgi:hypothetical protein
VDRTAIEDSNGSHPDLERTFGHNTITPMTSFVLIDGKIASLFVGHVGNVLPGKAEERRAMAHKLICMRYSMGQRRPLRRRYPGWSDR